VSKEFSMATVLRRIPFKMLHWFLPAVGIDLDVDWEKLHAYDLPGVIAAYEQCPDHQKAKAETTVKGIIVLANKNGIDALRQAAKNYHLTYWDVLFPPDASPYLQAIWAWNEHPDVFDMAKQILNAD